MLICGIGVNDYKEKVNIDGKIIKPYKVWYSMLNRCYSEKYQNRYPTYKDCTVCDEWLSFANFKKWYDENYPHHLENKGIKLDLDKDLLVTGNKIYSPDTCVFIPHEVNVLLAISRNSNTSGYQGISYSNHHKKWIVQTSKFIKKNKSRYIGLYDNINEANKAFIKARNKALEYALKYLQDIGYNEDIVNKIKSGLK